MKRSSSDGRLTRERAYSTDQHEESKTELFDFLKSATFSPTLSPPVVHEQPDAGMYDEEVRHHGANGMYNIDEHEEEDEDEGIFF